MDGYSWVSDWQAGRLWCHPGECPPRPIAGGRAGVSWGPSELEVPDTILLKAARWPASEVWCASATAPQVLPPLGVHTCSRKHQKHVCLPKHTKQD